MKKVCIVIILLCVKQLYSQDVEFSQYYANPLYLMKLIEAAEKESKLPIAIHLDHGPDFALCKQSIEDGFTSVMIDGSHYEFEENIKIIVLYFHRMIASSRFGF